MDVYTFSIHSLGCAKNQVDSEIMIASLCNAGFLYTEKPENADIIIINTCGFIEPAKEESIITSLEFRTRFPEKKIIIAGCLTERYHEALEKELPEIDGFTGNKNPESIGDVVKSIIMDKNSSVRERKKLLCKEEQEELSSGNKRKILHRSILLSFPGSAFVKIAEGCDNRCTYCTIPLIRGSLKSRPVKEIVDEISGLVSGGIREINLVAQDTGAFGNDTGKADIICLLQAISGLKERFWLRLLYIHPDRFPEKLCDFIKHDPRFLPYFDIPFQHASPRILTLMGRRGNPDLYLDLINTIRTTLPDAVIRSTFLTGFPGETDEDFHALTDFQQKAKLDWLGVFTYSREENTPACSLPGRVKKTVARKRKKILEQNQVPITGQRLSRFAGKKLDVLIEEPVNNEALFIGRAYLHAPDVDGLVVINSTGLTPGEIVRTRVMRVNNFDLEAVVLD